MQGSLSILYAILVAIVVVICVSVAIKSGPQFAAGQTPHTTEEEFTPSAYFAPTGLTATDAEKPLVEAWNARFPERHVGH